VQLKVFGFTIIQILVATVLQKAALIGMVWEKKAPLITVQRMLLFSFVSISRGEQ